MRKIFALLALLALLLCACGAPAAPGETTTAFDLAAIGDRAIAFDLTDLQDFLSEPQRAALETALYAELAAQGYPPESVALQFEDPAGDSLKLPFTNSGGSLANLDTDQLAVYIAGQIAEKVPVPETAVVTTTGMAAAVASTTTRATTIGTTTKPRTTIPTTITKPPTTTTKKPETTTKKQEYPNNFALTPAEEKQAEDLMRTFGNRDIYDQQGNPIAYPPAVYDLKNDPRSGKAGKIAILLEPVDGNRIVVAHIYGKKPGDQEYVKIDKIEQVIAATGSGDPSKTALINVMYGELDEMDYRNGLKIRYSFQYNAVDVFAGDAGMVQFNTKDLARYSQADWSSPVKDISGWFPAG